MSDYIPMMFARLLARPDGLRLRHIGEKFAPKYRDAARKEFARRVQSGEMVPSGVRPKGEHYFRTREDADRWIASLTTLHDVDAHIPGLTPRKGRQPPEMVNGLLRGPRAGRQPPHVGGPVVTVGKSAPVYSRHQVADGQQFEGAGFRRLKPGQYLAEASSAAARALT